MEAAFAYKASDALGDSFLGQNETLYKGAAAVNADLLLRKVQVYDSYGP